MLRNVKFFPPGGGHTTVSAAEEMWGRRDSACTPFPGTLVTPLFLFRVLSTSFSAVLE